MSSQFHRDFEKNKKATSSHTQREIYTFFQRKYELRAFAIRDSTRWLIPYYQLPAPQMIYGDRCHSQQLSDARSCTESADNPWVHWPWTYCQRADDNRQNWITLNLWIAYLSGRRFISSCRSSWNRSAIILIRTSVKRSKKQWSHHIAFMRRITFAFVWKIKSVAHTTGT